MKFQVGQKVLCVDDHFDYGPSPLIIGAIYTIDGFYLCPCGSHQVTLIEIPDITSIRCKCTRTLVRRQSYYNWRFVPFECSEIFTEISSGLIEDTEEIDLETVELHKELTSTASMYRTKY